LQKKFDKLGVQLVVVSTDDINVHKQWKNTLENLNYKDRGPIAINFPIVEDKSLTVSNKYGMISPVNNSTKAVRGVFIIDPDNIIQVTYFYPMRVGRNLDEVLRTVIALQATSDGNTLAPANWKEGDDLLVKAIPNSSIVQPDSSYYKYTWFMIYKKGITTMN
jgi:peroxiredoxin (alkyl hydroperoxide reductase subunit C)